MIKWLQISDDHPNHQKMGTGLFQAKALGGWLIYSQVNGRDYDFLS